MTTGLNLVKLLAASTVGFTSCLFVSLYGEVSTWVFKRDQSGAGLPAITICVIDFTRYLYAIPAIVLVAGIFLLRSPKARPVAFEIVIALAWIFAFGWALTAIFVWQVARMRIIN